MEQWKYKRIKTLEKELGIPENEIPESTLAINKLMDSLQKEVNAKRKKMRGKILHLLGLQGMTTKTGQLDYERINEFIVNIGSKNPRRVILNFLTCRELQNITSQVEAMLNKTLSK